MIRDAGALTSSITGGSLGLDESIYTLDAPLNDATTARVWTQEVRVAGGRTRSPWVAGAFFSRADRDYGQEWRSPGSKIERNSDARPARAHGHAVLLGPCLQAESVCALRRSDRVAHRAAQPDRRPSLLPLQRGQRADLRWHLRQRQQRHVAGVSARVNRRQRRRPPSHRFLQAVGYDTPERTGVTWLPSRRHQRSAQCAGLHAAGSCHVQWAGYLGRREGVELRGGVEVQSVEGAWHLQCGRLLPGHQRFQATVTAGSCSSRVVFNVPKARTRGVEVEFEAAPNRHIDFAVSATVNDSELRSTLTSTDASGNVSVVSGIEEGRRLPTYHDSSWSRPRHTSGRQGQARLVK